MSRTELRRVPLPDAELEVEVRGSGEPVVLIQTALTADELLPLAEQPALRDSHQVILYHRRGYAGSSAAEGPGSIERDALDCRRLLATLGIERAHVVGVSYSAAVALELAAGSPATVATLTVVEPPPVHIPDADEFLAANERLMEDYRSLGPAAALDRFLSLVVGPDWRNDIEQHIPGGTTQVERDAGTFFATDIPALLSWRFDEETARRVRQPVLYVGGTDSGPWFAEVRRLVLGWLPQAEDVLLEGADHSLAMTHPAQLGAALVDFLSRHPVHDTPGFRVRS